MRFPKETRALIQEAAPNRVTIKWPAGERGPKVGKTYAVQSLEERTDHPEREHNRREYHPETHREVMAGMHRRRHGEEAPNAPDPKPLSRSRRGCDRILVLAADVADGPGFVAEVVVFEDPDPVVYLPTKAKVRGGDKNAALATLTGAPLEAEEGNSAPVPTETEPEQMPPKRSRREREEEEHALAIEHRLSVDQASIMRAEQDLADQRKRGKSGTLAQMALEKAKRRAAESASEAA